MNLNAVNRATQIIDTGSDDLLSSIPAIERDIFRSIENELSSFLGPDGRFTMSDDSMEALFRIQTNINNTIAESNYGARVTGYLQNFSLLEQNAGNIFDDLNVSNIGLSNLREAAIRLTANNLIGQGLDVNFTQPVTNILFEYASTGGTITDARKQLEQFILGDEERLGHLNRYVGQISRDSISQFDGLINARVATEFNLDAVMYVGSLINDSRPQCKRWSEKRVIPLTELQAEINWAEINGTGWIQGTTVDTFMVNRGGYNCRHRAIPVSLEAVS